ncbi:LytR C-terminal domain-containing protein [Desulfurispira natronophila]|uniref:LytR/CpsA/Psr regulator C-terminal domain-containing protein n=1 Tax=Desulfurispira natronophila TaxID=682562 RepID=A0A7W7Y437_9BACT|nr:LytR C-terminal domain-containing protein [Desulfurispira natronophila]MBB5021462.1 hypothetical protein [Desulfurispira natronophila]
MNQRSAHLNYVLAFALALVLIQSVHAASSYDGGESLMTIGDSRVLDPGQATWFFPFYLESFGEERGETLDVPWGMRIGLYEGFELNVSLPYRQDQELEKDGLRFVRLGGKMQLFGGEVGERSGAMSFFGTVADDSSEALGTARTNYGLEFLVSEPLGPLTSLHSAIGLQRSDGRVPLLDPADDDFDPDRHYQNTTTFYYKLGLEQYFMRKGAFMLEAATRMGLNGDDVQDQFSISVMPGLRFGDPHQGWTLSLGAGYDIPDNGLEPETRYMLGLSYRPPVREARESEPEVVEEPVGIEEESTEVEEAASLDMTLVEAADDRLRIELLNASGVPELLDVMAERLTNMGYRVVRLGVAEDHSVLETSHIHYRVGFAEEAITLGHSLTGNYQIVTRGREMPEDLQLRMLIGTDMQ